MVRSDSKFRFVIQKKKNNFTKITNLTLFFNIATVIFQTFFTECFEVLYPLLFSEPVLGSTTDLKAFNFGNSSRVSMAHRKFWCSRGKVHINIIVKILGGAPLICVNWSSIRKNLF